MAPTVLLRRASLPLLRSCLHDIRLVCNSGMWRAVSKEIITVVAKMNRTAFPDLRSAQFAIYTAQPRAAGIVFRQLDSTLQRAVFRARSDLQPRAAGFATEAYQYEAAGGGPGGEVSVIEDVDFDASIANTVSLMGNVGNKPEIKYLENGNKVSTLSIAFQDKRGGESQW